MSEAHLRQYRPGPRIDIYHAPTFGTRVLINGVEIHGLNAVNWNNSVNEKQRVTLTILPGEVTFTPIPNGGITDDELNELRFKQRDR